MNRVMTVAQLSSYLKGVFDDEELLHDVTLSGEVAEVSYSDKHTFLTLAEGDISVRCVHFSARDKIQKGEKLALKGSVRFYGKRGTVTFAYTEYFVQGEGAKNAKLAALKEKLQTLGYFENRPTLPKYIVSVAVITSPDGAAIRDLIHVVRSKNPFVTIKVYPVKVQGEGAPEQMARAVTSLQSYAVDAIVLCRGGGSDEDLDSFNDERLATAVALSRIPIISAVGHQVDYTLCDFCAGTRAGTPSIAGEIINERASALIADIYDCLYACFETASARLDGGKRALNGLIEKFSYALDVKTAKAARELDSASWCGYYAARRKTERAESELSELISRLHVAAENNLNSKRIECDKLQATLSALDPHRIIKTGYAAVLADKTSVKSAAQLKKGDTVELVFADGTAIAVIQSTDKK